MGFLEDLIEHMSRAIENPGEACATESYTIKCTPEEAEEYRRAWAELHDQDALQIAVVQ